LNQVSEIQGDTHGTFKRIIFSPESWDYFVLKLCGGFGLTLHLLEERLLKYRLTCTMSRQENKVRRFTNRWAGQNWWQDKLRKSLEHPWRNYCIRCLSKKSNLEAQVQAAKGEHSN
jgi:hypothetical protein